MKPPPWVTGPPWWVLLGARVVLTATVIMSDPIRAARICATAITIEHRKDHRP